MRKAWINPLDFCQYKIARNDRRGARDMATDQLSQVVQHLRSLVANRETEGIPDADLLKRYVHERDEAAFETMVRRHGPMVLGVCHRLLHNSHDVEDAFQVTFLVLVRKASGLRSPGTIGNWLYGVAYRTALEARKASARRRAKEAQVVPRTESSPERHADVRSMLDQELRRLPDKHREVVVLCDLEGKTRKEAALDLGCAEGTVASRLARARTVLAKRLSRHGLPLSAGAMALALAENVAAASVPASIISSTLKAAGAYAGKPAAASVVSVNVAALTQGVLRTMFFTKLKIATAILAGIIVAGVGAGSLIYETQAAQSNDQGKAATRNQPKKLTPLSSDDLRGKWTGEKNGVKVELTFYGEEGIPGWEPWGGETRWQAHWWVECKKHRWPAMATDFPKCVADPDHPGRLQLFLPAYAGDRKDLKESSWNGRKPVGEVEERDKETMQLRIIPTGYQNYDFPAVEGLVLHRVEENGPSLKPAAEEEVTIETAPPVVVKTVPQAGATDVDAKTKEIQITFSKDMMDGSWSWSQLSDGSFPKIVGKPTYLKDKRTCVATVKLEPDKTYAIWLNSEKFHGFQDADGRAAVPYLLVFKTAK
jgi:RNA polymerase sigma factor (sigma-70 family)